MDNPPEDVSKVFNLIMAAWGSQAVRALSYLSVAEHLAAGPLAADEIAKRESADPAATFRLLRVAAALGLAEPDPASGAFRSTPALQVLHGDNPDSLKFYARAAIGPVFWRPAVRLPDAIRDGRPQTVAELGADTVGYLGRHPEEALEFGTAFTGLSAPVIRSASALIEPGDAKVVVDVGGAEGAFVAALLSAHPQLTGVNLELPAVVPGAQAEAQRRGLADRLDAVPGDFLDSVPSGDIYLLKFVLHGIDDSACVRLLSNIRAAMPAGARLYVVEMLSGDGHVPPGLAFMDMAMLFGSGGQERSLEAYDALLAEAQLVRTGLDHLLEPYGMIEAQPIRKP